jgi:hypothetical protein
LAQLHDAPERYLRLMREALPLYDRLQEEVFLACAGIMLLALVWIAITLSVGWPPKALLAGEWTTDAPSVRRQPEPAEAGAAVPA